MTEIIQTLNARAPTILRTLSLMEVQIAVLALIVLGIARWRWCSSPNVHYALWLVVLAKSLLPPFMQLPRMVSLPGELIELPMSSLDSRFDVSIGSLSIPSIILTLWLLASLTLLVVALLRHLSLRALLKNSQSYPIQNEDTVNSLHFCWPPVWRADHLPTPIAIGLLYPRIYLPTAATQFDAATMQAILCHELAHVLRRDGWIVMLQTMSQILHPFNPLVWLMNLRLHRYREQICDDFALRYATLKPRQYGEMLLRFLEPTAFSPIAVQTATCLFETKNGFKQRLKYLFSRKEADMKRLDWKQKLLLAGMMLALIPVSWQCSHEEKVPAAPFTPQQGEMLAGTDRSLVAYDTPPEPIGGFGKISKSVQYPEDARRAGIEGTVYLEVLILENGQADVKVVQSPHLSLAAAAIAAVQRVSWKPALRQGKAVAVKVMIPVKFKLS